MARTKKLTDYVYSPTDPASEDAIRAQIDDSIQEVYDQSAQTADVVLLTTDQTVAGIKTFSSSPIVPTPVLDFQSATKKYIDDVAAGFVLGEVSDNSITPTKLTPLSRTLFTNKSYLNSGTANALAVATDGEADYTVDNWIVSVIPLVNNTGTITLNVDGKGVKNVQKVVDGAYVDLEADDIEALKDKSFRWSVSNDFFVKAPSSSGGNIAWLQIYDTVEGNNILKTDKDKDVMAKAGQYLYSEFYALKVGTQIIPPTTQATSASDLLVLADGTVEMANPEQDQVYQGFISNVDLWDADMEGAGAVDPFEGTPRAFDNITGSTPSSLISVSGEGMLTSYTVVGSGSGNFNTSFTIDGTLISQRIEKFPQVPNIINMQYTTGFEVRHSNVGIMAAYAIGSDLSKSTPGFSYNGFFATEGKTLRTSVSGKGVITGLFGEGVGLKIDGVWIIGSDTQTLNFEDTFLGTYWVYNESFELYTNSTADNATIHYIEK